MTQPPQRTPTPGGQRSLPERRGRDRRVLAVGLAISVLVHVVALVLISDWLTPAPGPSPRLPDALHVEAPRGMRAIEMRDEGDPTSLERPDEPAPEARTDPAPARQVAAAPEPPPEMEPADVPSAAERLAPRVVDYRLWQPMVLVPREPTIGDVEARIAAAVELLSDSALAEADAAIRARDWTVQDDSGGKWGVSPGKLHLGSVTLPLPIWFPVDPAAIEADAMWYELDQQLERTRILDSFEERVRAIRERREKERAEARARGDNGGV